jgi:tetratricopeptide (TPR) repeat protein
MSFAPVLALSLAVIWLAVFPATNTEQGREVMRILSATETGQRIDVTFKDPGELLSQFRTVASRWIAEAGETDRAHRRNVVALATLRLHILPGTSLVSLRELIDWMEAQWPAASPTEFERVWRLTMLGRTCLYDPDHVRLVERSARRFPGEARFRLLSVIARWRAANRFTDRPGVAPDLLTWARLPCARVTANVYTGRGNATAARAEIRDAIAALSSLTDDSTVGLEARLRLSVLQFALGELDDALANVRAAMAIEDREVRYIAHYVIGLVYGHRGEYERARSAFAAAVELIPGALSGVRQLAAHEVLAGHSDAAAPLLGERYVRFAGTDPTQTYSKLEHRFDEERMRQLETMVRR